MSSPRSAWLRRLTAGAFVLGCIPLAALAAGASAPGSAAAASAPGSTGPTVGAEIASKCKAMSGDERASCIADTRAAGASRHAHRSRHHGAAKQARAASAAG